MTFDKTISVAGAVACAVMTASAPAMAEIYTFDDVTPPNFTTPIAPAPGPLTFKNFYTLNSQQFTAKYGYSGYTLGLGNVAYSGFGQIASFSSSGTFTFNGAYMNTAWNSVMEVTVVGFARSAIVYNQTLRLNSLVPIFYNFDWTDIDSVEFVTGRTVDANYALDGNQIVFDDITVNEPIKGEEQPPQDFATAAVVAVPEPGTWALMIAGVGLVGGALRRRTRALLPA